MRLIKKNKFLIISIALILIGSLLRFYNLSWDQNLSFHPDERNIANAVSKISFFDNLNPEFFAYGSFPIYLYRATGDTLNYLLKTNIWTTNWGHISLIGRLYSAFFSSLSLVAILYLARKLFPPQAAIIALTLAIFSPSLIQTAHFAVTESMLVFFILLILILSLSLKKARIANFLLLGIVSGVTLSTKTTSLSFFIIPTVAFILFLQKKDFLKRISLAIVSLFSAISTFIILSPYTLLSWDKFTESMEYEFGVVRGTRPVPYTLQFTNTPPYLFQLKNLLWQFGPTVYIGIIALFLLLAFSIIKRRKSLIIFAAFPLIYFAYVGSWHTKFIRYMLPLIPFIAISSGWILGKIINSLKLTGTLVVFLALATSTIWGLAFFSIYTKPQTRVEASEWIYKNIPDGSIIYNEHWDDGLPVALPPNNPGAYQRESLEMYNPDNQQKIDYLAKKLSEGDFLVLNSRRLWGTLISLEEKYPITSRYYKLLFTERLGYQQIHTFSSYPEILGVVINDSNSEETLQVYDHPTVRIFQNTEQKSYSEIKSLLSI